MLRETRKKELKELIFLKAVQLFQERVRKCNGSRYYYCMWDSEGHFLQLLSEKGKHIIIFR